MRFSCLLLILLFSGAFAVGQALDSNQKEDRKYLEDQFYFGFTYNFATNLPSGGIVLFVTAMSQVRPLRFF